MINEYTTAKAKSKPDSMAVMDSHDYMPAPAPIRTSIAPIVSAVAPKSYNLLGSGGYGAVFSPAFGNNVDGKYTEFPNQVTKVFFEKSNMEKAFKSAENVKKLTKNKGHRAYRYTRKYTLKDLPYKIKTEIKTIIKNETGKKLKDMNNIHLMRLPNLGVDIEHVDAALSLQLRKIPVMKILTQIHKLIEQTNRFVEFKHIHGDIRETNVMVNPEVGTMTIIDFDLYASFDKVFYKVMHHKNDNSKNGVKPYTHDDPHAQFGMYHTPPETAWFNEIHKISSYKPDDTIKRTISHIKLNDYIRNSVGISAYSLKGSFTNAYKLKGITEATFYTEFWNAMKDNLLYIQSTKSKSDFIMMDMEYIDNYGLGLTLLELLARIYPGIPLTGTDISAFKSFLKGNIKNKDKPYSNAKLNKIVVALQETVRLLNRMSSFRISERPTPREAFERMSAIVAEYIAVVPTVGTIMATEGISESKGSDIESVKPAGGAGAKLNGVTRRERKLRKMRKTIRRR